MANEKRLIDANALMDEFRRYMVERYDREKCVSEENCNTCDRGCLWWKIVNNAPTVDVAEMKWIPVSERLPDKDGNYLTYDPRYGDIEIYYYMGLDEWDHHRNGITDAESHGFTHWMPLPQPPKGE